MKINYDPEGDVLEIRFSESAIDSSEYMEESGLILDYDKVGKEARKYIEHNYRTKGALT